MNLKFTKMQACGNDFIIVDDRAGLWIGQEPMLARKLCPRRFAIGADGLLVLRGGRSAGQFDMVFVNADGLIGEMCGNGARCMAAFIQRAGLVRDGLQLHTPAGAVTVHFAGDGQIMLDLPPSGTPRLDIEVLWQGEPWRFDAIDIGAPHAVCFVADRTALAAVPVDALGRHVRHDRAFMPRGVNINFVALHEGRLHMRTYERGVEGETQGCGTGASASALLAHARFALPSPVTVQTSSGELLTVRFRADHSALQLEGGAHFVADGELVAGFLDDQSADVASASATAVATASATASYAAAVAAS